MTEVAQQSRTRSPRRVVGIVTAAQRTPKTIRVAVQYRVLHSEYRKYVRHRTVMYVHDEKSEARLGDRVEVMECRPVSRMKKWRLVRIVEKAPQEQATVASA